MTDTRTISQLEVVLPGGQTAGHRELWRLLRSLFKETNDTEELID